MDISDAFKNMNLTSLSLIIYEPLDVFVDNIIQPLNNIQSGKDKKKRPSFRYSPINKKKK